MDLGFGTANQVVGDAASRLMLQTAKAQEKAIESELAAYDALLEDDDALEALRARRLEQMKQQQQKRQEWKAMGHGEYTELGGGTASSDVAKAFFEASKSSPKMVVHFYRSTSAELCDVFHAHLSKLAPQHFETRFVKINVDGCDHGNGGAASYLVEKLGIVVMPTLVIVKDRKVIHHIRGFDELGGTKDFSTKALEYVLGVHEGVNLPEGTEIPSELLPENQQGVNAIRIRGGSRFSGINAKKLSIRDGISSGRFDDDDYC